MTSAGLMISNMKVAVQSDELKEALPFICGMYKLSKDGSLPTLKPRKTWIGKTENVDPVVSINPSTGVVTLPGSGPVPQPPVPGTSPQITVTTGTSGIICPQSTPS